MIDVTVKFEGLKELEEKLGKMGDRLAKKTLRKALVAGGKVMQDAVTGAAPVRTDVNKGGNSLKPGELKGDIQLAVKMSGRQQRGTCFVGPSDKTWHVAHWINDGFVLTTHGKKRFRTKIKNIPANPFMLTAFTRSADQALSAFTEELKRGVEEVAK